MAKKVYISGPYSFQAPGIAASRTQRAAFKANADALANRLRDAGFDPFYPQMLYGSWHGAFDFSEPWPDGPLVDQSLHWLRASVAVIQIPGYSPGGDAEVDLAESLGIPVYQVDDIDNLIDG